MSSINTTMMLTGLGFGALNAGKHAMAAVKAAEDRNNKFICRRLFAVCS
jgi:hypothetical protein